MSLSKKITVAGSTNTDLIIKLPSLPKPGETIIGGTFFTASGGKGCNQAVAAKRAGAEVVFISSVGNDHFGEQAIRMLTEEGIKTEYIKVISNEASGTALIFVDNNGENSIGVASGANEKLIPGIIDNKILEEIKSSALILMQLETPLSTIEYIASIGAAAGVKVILNPAPAQKLSENLLKNIFLISPNENEAELLTGVKVTDAETAEKSAQVLISSGVENVIITMGAKGCYLKTKKMRSMIPSFKVDAVDTTAAGDVFNGALASALADGMELADAAVFASAAAAISVTKIGAQTSIPEQNEIKSFINKQTIAE